MNNSNDRRRGSADTERLCVYVRTPALSHTHTLTPQLLNDDDELDWSHWRRGTGYTEIRGFGPRGV